MQRSWKLIACASALAMALAGCASSPSVPPAPPTRVAVEGASMSAPAAWAMQPSRSTQILESLFWISETASKKTPTSSNTYDLMPSSAPGLKPKINN